MLTYLKDFFFEQKTFSTLSSKPKLDKYLLPYTLLSRKGPEELLLLILEKRLTNGFINDEEPRHDDEHAE